MNQFEKKISEMIIDFYQKSGHLTSTDIETETINLACLELIKKHGDKINKTHDVNRLQNSIDRNMWLLDEIQPYTAATRSLYSDVYTSNMANGAVFLILQNISWAGMWDFLRNYYSEKHGIFIDQKQTDVYVFNSSNHKRYEFNNLVNHSTNAERIIKLSFSENKTEITVSIEPSLSMKKGRLNNKNGNMLTYIGYDTDYLFHICFDRFEEVDSFTLELPNRALKLEYYK